MREEPTTVRQTLARAAALLGVLVVAIAGCGDSDDGPSSSVPRTTTTHEPEPSEPKQRGIVLQLDRESVSAGDRLELTIVNPTKKRFDYGVPYRLEHFVDGEWRWINKEAVFIAILKVIEPRSRERQEIELPGHLEPGRYRIVKSFSASPGGREVRRSVEFRVR